MSSNVHAFPRLEAEAAVIGGVLIEAGKLASADLQPTDFTDRKHRAIWATILRLAGQAKPIDLVALLTEFEGRDDELYRECARIARDTYSAANVAAYAESVREASRLREARQIAQRLMSGLASDGPEAIERALAELSALGNTSRRWSMHISEAVKAAIDQIDKVLERGGAIEISTGLAELDEILGGWHEGDLAVIGSRPAMGKTALLMNLADRCGVPAGLISAEQGHEQIGMRAASMQSRVDLVKMRAANLEMSDYTKLTDAVLTINNRNLWVNDMPAPNIGQVVAQTRQWRYEHGIRVLYVDYTQRIRGMNRSAKRFEQVAEVTMGLKELARELRIPVVALAQVKRDVESRPDKRPHMGDMSDSSEIEKEADQILTLYRDEVYNPQTQDKGIAELAIEKNRHGPTGLVKVAWIPGCLRFENLAHRDEWSCK